MDKSEYYKIEDGQVIGYVGTKLIGSEKDFVICSVEEWEEMSNEQREEAAQEAMFNEIEWGY